MDLQGTPDAVLARGVYPARRAAALAGIPQSTLNYWARTGIYRPSVSPNPRVRLWSWMDLLALRALDWLRRSKGADEPPRVSAHRLRRLVLELERMKIPRSSLHDFVAIERAGGELFIQLPDTTVVAGTGGQTPISNILEVVRPYQSGPDLVQPRPTLRIIPGKLHGEPHLAGTRIQSTVIFALHKEGFSVEQIHEMFPDAQAQAVREAIELEESLSKVA